MMTERQPESVIEYVFRDMKNGEFWLDIRVDRQPYAEIGPFDSAGDRQNVHDDLLKMMRQVGARDLPALPQ